MNGLRSVFFVVKSWEDTITEVKTFINVNLQNKGQLVDISVSFDHLVRMSGVVTVYYVDSAVGAPVFSPDPKIDCLVFRHTCEWKAAMDTSTEVFKFIEKKRAEGTLFGINHSSGYNLNSKLYPTTFVWYWSSPYKSLSQ
eukprot:TRINITY_DN3021_c0_g1_i1.p1 TRINITY_DN3021_c0_g1~~TRINITY_DN3021_c0_g1_i1.p1  ORF type:complete len:140 (-),score=17.25 TRINITY_DN3021_c0_g1_i1:4-423(-)